MALYHYLIHSNLGVAEFFTFKKSGQKQLENDAEEFKMSTGDYLFSLLADARKLHPRGMFDTSIENKNTKGIGGFKNEVLRKFVKDISSKHENDCVFTVALCRDTDVFDFSLNPL